jgi:hypothetical protein
MATLYFCYSTVQGLDAPEPLNSPYTITWHVGRFLREKARAIGYEFRYANLDDLTPTAVHADDIVIGHTLYPDGWMNRALDSAARIKIILQPYQPCMVGEGERDWIKALFAKADWLLLITGPYHWDNMPDSPFAGWQAKATRLDMAVNPAQHPHSKKTWNAPGKRRGLAIGADNLVKGLDLIADLARWGGFHLSYFGNAPQGRFQHVPQFMHYGGQYFTPDVQAEIARQHDFFISLARADACPTTLLETACWGLLPLANAESGYWPNRPFVELRLEDMLFNLEQIDWLQRAPEYELQQRAARIREQVLARHTWARFCESVWHEVERRL